MSFLNIALLFGLGAVAIPPIVHLFNRRKFEVVDFDADMATVYGTIIQRHGFSRRKIIDRMIAATAIARRAVLITANASDFAEIEDLKLEIWPVA